MVRQHAPVVIPPTARLNSWKEIAQYLDRGVRTVQRWERELQMPVHRIGRGKRSPVFATTTELNFWVSTTGVLTHPAQARVLEMRPKNGNPVEEVHRLMSNIHTLVQTMAETSVRQRRQAELLQKRIVEIRARMR